MRGSVMVLSVCVALAGGGAVGCAKPGPVRSQPLKASSQDEVSNPGVVADVVNEEAKKMGAMKK